MYLDNIPFAINLIDMAKNCLINCLKSNSLIFKAFINVSKNKRENFC